MATKPTPTFDPRIFLAKANGGRTISKYRKQQVVFAQGDPADAVFYIQTGKVKITVVSERGKEAVVAVMGPDEFCGEGCLAGQAWRMATAVAMTECEIMRVEKAAMLRVLHEEQAFSEMFLSHLLKRTIRVEEDLVDQLFNSSEKRLARALLLLANFGKEGRPEPVIAPVSQEKNAGRDDRHDTIPRELLHEQVPPYGFHQLQRPLGSPYVIAESRSPRTSANSGRPRALRGKVTRVFLSPVRSPNIR